MCIRQPCREGVEKMEMNQMMRACMRVGVKGNEVGAEERETSTPAIFKRGKVVAAMNGS